MSNDTTNETGGSLASVTEIVREKYGEAARRVASGGGALSG